VVWDGARALLTLNGPGSAPAEQLDLATGRLTQVPLPAGVVPFAYTQPRGENILALTPPVGTSLYALNELERFDLAGNRQAVLAAISQPGAALSSPDGTEYAIGTGAGIRLISNSGRAIRTLTVPGIDTRFGCDPMRWWNPTTLLARCTPPPPAVNSRLWTVPLDGSPPAALTPASTYNTAINAWQLPSGRYLQVPVTGGCGAGAIARQAADGSISLTPLASALSGNFVITAVGDRMLVQTSTGCGNGTSVRSLRWFDPAAGTVQPLLTAQPGEQGVTAAIPFGKLST
jgi:TolB protein